MGMGMGMGEGTGPDLTMGGSWPLFAATWVAMMVAMMFPAAAPMVLLYGRMRRHDPASVALFTGSYLALWCGFGVAAYLVSAGVETAGVRLRVGGDELGPCRRWIAGARGCVPAHAAEGCLLAPLPESAGVRHVALARRAGRCHQHGPDPRRLLHGVLLAVVPRPDPARDHERRGDGRGRCCSCSSRRSRRGARWRSAWPRPSSPSSASPSWSTPTCCPPSHSRRWTVRLAACRAVAILRSRTARTCFSECARL